MLTAPIVALFLIAAPDNTYSLQWKLKEGEVFYNKTTVEMDQTIEAMGQSIDQKIKMNTVLKFKVKSVSKGSTVVEMTYLENKIEGLPGLNIGDKLKNVIFTATLDDKMQVKKLEGYDKFLDALSNGDDTQKKVMKSMMPETSVRQMFGQTFAIAPEKPLAVGDDWKRTDKMSLGPLGNVETTSTFKLQNVKGDVADITFKGELEFKAGDSEDNGLPFKITKADLKAEKFSGSHHFDIKLGRVTESKMEMEMNGTMTIGVAGQMVNAKLRQKMTANGVITDKNPIVD